MNPHDTNSEGSAELAADLIMGQPHRGADLAEQAAMVMDRLALEAHRQVSAADQHWQIAIHLWPALKSIARHTELVHGHLLAAGVDADMLAGLGPHPHYPQDPQRHLVFHTPIPPTSQWPHHDVPLYELGTHDDPRLYDLVLVNLPYHDAALLDPGRRTRLGFYHQELLTSALDQAMPGRLVVGLTSPVFLDHPDPDLRQSISDKADLVGAVRLPSRAMRPGSHAEGPTDILILRRRSGPTGRGIPPAVEVTTGRGRGHLNEYWIDNSRHVLGQLWHDPNAGAFIVDPGREPLGGSLQVAFQQISSAIINDLDPNVNGAARPKSHPRQSAGSANQAATPDL